MCYILKVFFILFPLYEYFACIYVHQVHTKTSKVRRHELLLASRQLPSGCWDLNPGFLQDNTLLLITMQDISEELLYRKNSRGPSHLFFHESFSEKAYISVDFSGIRWKYIDLKDSFVSLLATWHLKKTLFQTDLQLNKNQNKYYRLFWNDQQGNQHPPTSWYVATMKLIRVWHNNHLNILNYVT